MVARHFVRPISFVYIVLAVCLIAVPQIGRADEPRLKYFLMIVEPNSAAWKGVIESGGDMAVPARQAIEAMGGQLLSYYIGVAESKNYGIVAFPDSYDTAKIIYLRSAQGLMKSMEFVEIIPSDQAAGLFKEVNSLLNPPSE